MNDLSPLFTWRSAIADSDLPPTARLVAWGLALHMNERGGSCWPSVETVARETGLSERTVRVQIRVLTDRRWLRVDVGGGRGKSSRYTATVPKGAAETPNDVPPLGERGNLATEKGADDDAKGGSTCPRERQEDDRRSSSSSGLAAEAARLHARRALGLTSSVVADAFAWRQAAATKWLTDNHAEIERHIDHAVDAADLLRLVDGRERKRRGPSAECTTCSGTGWLDTDDPATVAACDCRTRRTA